MLTEGVLQERSCMGLSVNQHAYLPPSLSEPACMPPTPPTSARYPLSSARYSGGGQPGAQMEPQGIRSVSFRRNARTLWSKSVAEQQPQLPTLALCPASPAMCVPSSWKTQQVQSLSCVYSELCLSPVNFASVSVESVNYPSCQFGQIRPLALFASVFLRCHLSDTQRRRCFRLGLWCRPQQHQMAL